MSSLLKSLQVSQPTVSQCVNNFGGPNADDISRAKQGHRESLEYLIYHFTPALENYLHGCIPKKYASLLSIEDIHQETIIRTYKSIEGLQAKSPAGFFAWLRQIADNVLRSQIRKLDTKKRGGGHQKVGDAEVDVFLDENPTPLQQVELNEVVTAVKANVDCLPSTQRKVVKKILLESQTMKETAEELGTTPATVRGLLNRALKTMRNGLGGSTNWFSKKK
jgi:RNA polymerase sigma factor (sigma-70 family)